MDLVFLELPGAETVGLDSGEEYGFFQDLHSSGSICDPHRTQVCAPLPSSFHKTYVYPRPRCNVDREEHTF